VAVGWGATLRKLAVVVVSLAVAGAAALAAVVVRPDPTMPVLAVWSAGILAWAIGAAVAVGELVARYRDEPQRALVTWPALVYMGVNAVGAGIAFALVWAFDWKLGLSDDLKPPQVILIQALTAGFGSMALFRTSFFTVRAADKDIDVGPSAVLKAVLTAADRAIDRTRAKSRVDAVTAVMGGISFEKAQEALPALCLTLMQNLSPDDQKTVATAVEGLRRSKVDDHIKPLLLALELLNFVGEDVLVAAVASLGPQIRTAETVSLRQGGKVILAPASAKQFDVQAVDSTGQAVSTFGATWSSSAPSVVSVTQSGFVTGLTAGRAVVTVSLDGKTAEAEVDVVEGSGVTTTGSAEPGTPGLQALLAQPGRDGLRSESPPAH
jgi:hypothetical protein